MRVTQRESTRASQAGAPTHEAAAPHGSAAGRGGRRRRLRGGSRRRPAARACHTVSPQRAVSTMPWCRRIAPSGRHCRRRAGVCAEWGAAPSGQRPSTAWVATALSLPGARPAPAGKRGAPKLHSNPEASAGPRLGRARRHAQRQEGARALVVRECLQRPQLHAEPAGRARSAAGPPARRARGPRARTARPLQEMSRPQRMADASPMQGRGTLHRLRGGARSRAAPAGRRQPPADRRAPRLGGGPVVHAATRQSALAPGRGGRVKVG